MSVQLRRQYNCVVLNFDVFFTYIWFLGDSGRWENRVFRPRNLAIDNTEEAENSVDC